MPDDDSGGIVSRAELEALASLYDAFVNALNPDAREAHEAEAAFCREVDRIYDERVAPLHGKALPRIAFAAHLRTTCRRFLISSEKKR